MFLQPPAAERMAGEFCARFAVPSTGSCRLCAVSKGLTVVWLKSQQMSAAQQSAGKRSHRHHGLDVPCSICMLSLQERFLTRIYLYGL